MAQTKTMVVIPKDLLEALRYNQKQQMGQVGERLVTLDQEMKSVLSQEGISDNEKAQQYFQTLQKYMAAKEMAKTPVLEVKKPTITPGKILNDIPSQQQKRAEKIFNWLDRVAPDISWNETGEVEGIPGSNIADLVTALSKSKSSSDPTGFNQFAELLQKKNIPRTLVANAKHWNTYFTPTISPVLQEDDIYEPQPSQLSRTPAKSILERDIFGTPPQTPSRSLRSGATERRSPLTQRWLQMKSRP